MWAVHIRLAELWMIQKQRKLTEEEETEFRHCLEANANMAWKLAKLKNMSLMASIVQDTDWQHEICKEIDRVYPYGWDAL